MLETVRGEECSTLSSLSLSLALSLWPNKNWQLLLQYAFVFLFFVFSFLVFVVVGVGVGVGALQNGLETLCTMTAKKKNSEKIYSRHTKIGSNVKLRCCNIYSHSTHIAPILIFIFIFTLICPLLFYLTSFHFLLFRTKKKNKKVAIN